MRLHEEYLSTLWPLLPVLIAISLWFGVKAGGDNLLKNETARSGIGSLQRAGKLEQARWIIASWEERAPERRSQAEIDKQGWLSRLLSNEGRMLTDVARRSLVFDFFFIVFYATAMAVACLLAATEIEFRSRTRRSRLINFGICLAWMQIVTALSDVVENIALWRVLRNSAAWSIWPPLASFCSYAKYALLAISLCYVFIAFGFWVFDHRPQVRRMIQART